ncbi:unnamed protein product [Oppiella nova]|uniref:Uncharacterized protein n=1 Tax=Oppiella nova TaxID=334625 RepID=A0A7R9MIU7_9ACAR|nr:unnamed protein product [Oppiella nova]CAG2178183.1 unnamed protein product [Oppiella nova]
MTYTISESLYGSLRRAMYVGCSIAILTNSTTRGITIFFGMLSILLELMGILGAYKEAYLLCITYTVKRCNQDNTVSNHSLPNQLNYGDQMPSPGHVPNYEPPVQGMTPNGIQRPPSYEESVSNTASTTFLLIMKRILNLLVVQCLEVLQFYNLQVRTALQQVVHAIIDNLFGYISGQVQFPQTM